MADADMHVHTLYSRGDGVSPPEDMVRAAEKKGLCAIAITDHDTMDAVPIARAASSSVHIIPGCEVSSADGHILAYFISAPVPRDMSAQDTIDAIHVQGGLAVASHPLDRRRHGVGEYAFTLPFDAIEARNGHNLNSNAETEARARAAGIPMIAGSDAHMAKEVGSCVTRMPSCDDIAAHILAGRTQLVGAPVSRVMLFEKAIRTYVLRQVWRK